MDFTLGETQQAVAQLAAQVLTGPDPWKELARAGLLDVSPPDGLGVLEVAVLLTEIGQRAPSMKALATLMTGALPLARWGRPALLPAVASGELILTAALREPSHPAPLPPVTAVTDGTLTGLKIGVPYAAEATLLLIPALVTSTPARRPTPAPPDSMIMGSFDHIATEIAHDHETPCLNHPEAAPQGIPQRLTSNSSPRGPTPRAHPARRLDRIMRSLPQKHPERVWRIRSAPVSMKASLLSAVGECVEALRSAIPRLSRVTSDGAQML
jgi:hypothetical protein